MAFVMRGDWQEEPLSIEGLVELSPGILEFDARAFVLRER